MDQSDWPGEEVEIMNLQDILASSPLVKLAVPYLI